MRQRETSRQEARPPLKKADGTKPEGTGTQRREPMGHILTGLMLTIPYISLILISILLFICAKDKNQAPPETVPEPPGATRPLESPQG